CWLRQFNALSDYDQRLIIYAGQITTVSPHHAAEWPYDYNVTRGAIAELGLESDGVVPVGSARFDDRPLISDSSRRVFGVGRDYDHTQMWQGKEGDGNLLFNTLSSDLTTVAASVNKPGKFRITARSECVGNSERVRVTRVDDSVRATEYRIW